jgi:hypothetical protein
MRECPAAGRPIEAFECAAGRHTTYACPECCPFNVFATANYPKVQAIEHTADEKHLAWVSEHAADQTQLEADMRRLVGDRPSPAFFHRLAWLEKAPPELQVREGAKALIIAALRAVVDTLDQAARSD